MNIEAIRRGISDVFTAKLLFFLAMGDPPDVTGMIQIDTSPGKQAKLVRIRNLKGHGIWVLGRLRREELAGVVSQLWSAAYSKVRTSTGCINNRT